LYTSVFIPFTLIVMAVVKKEEERRIVREPHDPT
jgi:hypothetical protein